METVDGSPPYYSEVLDNLEMSDLANPAARKLVYGGSWAHENGKGMYNVQRSLSTSQGSGSTLTYTFAGTGLDIIGPNDGSAVLQVTVDGRWSTPQRARSPLPSSIRRTPCATSAPGRTPCRSWCAAALSSWMPSGPSGRDAGRAGGPTGLIGTGRLRGASVGHQQRATEAVACSAGPAATLPVTTTTACTRQSNELRAPLIDPGSVSS